MSRLGEGRAAGIHLGLPPSVGRERDAMQLRANLGNRSFSRWTPSNFRDALGGGAENLLETGTWREARRQSGLCYAQVPLADTAFVERVVAAIQAGEQV